MNRTDSAYINCINILREELQAAMGCTEPIALAYAGAKTRELLGTIPDKVCVKVSGNIIKNVKSVVVPNTGGLCGIGAALSAGIVAGNPDKVLEVISDISVEKQKNIKEFIETVPMTIVQADSNLIFDIDVMLFNKEDTARLRMVNHHTNIVYMSKNNEVLLDKPFMNSSEDSLTDKSFLTVDTIVDFANSVQIEDVKELVMRQAEYNYSIAQEGIRGNWGANIGSVILERECCTLEKKACAYAAAASDARMSGCEKPVIILSGSGNQGITSSVPIVVYAKELNLSEEKMIRAIVVSDLITIYQKKEIGRLSAYCGAISAGCGAGAGIAYLLGENSNVIADTLENSVAILSGTICDGAKASCAAKIASAVDAGIMGYHMSQKHQKFQSGNGIVGSEVDNTVKNVGKLAREGMKETDKVILQIMLDN